MRLHICQQEVSFCPVIIVFITLQNQSVRHIPDGNSLSNPKSSKMADFVFKCNKEDYLSCPTHLKQ
jgi:hypothetical protein